MIHDTLCDVSYDMIECSVDVIKIVKVYAIHLFVNDGGIAFFTMRRLDVWLMQQFSSTL